MHMRRYWINCQSKSHPYHRYNGMVVLGPSLVNAQGKVLVYPMDIANNVKSFSIDAILLSPWHPYDPSHEYCFCSRAMSLSDRDLELAIKAIDDYFVSGNNVPVERATIKREEWEAVKAFLAERDARQAAKSGPVDWSSVDYVTDTAATTYTREVDTVRGSLEAQPDGTIHFEEYSQADKVQELERFIELAFEAHPNLDLDIEAIKATKGE